MTDAPRVLRDDNAVINAVCPCGQWLVTKHAVQITCDVCHRTFVFFQQFAWAVIEPNTREPAPKST